MRVLLLATLAGAAAADEPELPRYRHDLWTSDEGLPENSVNAIVQSRDGYLWLGTYEGLVRFDGVQFTVFDRSNTKAMTNSIVYSLLEDRAGDLWIGTNGGGLLRYRDGTFTAYAADGRSGLRNQVVRALFEDRSGTLWVGTDGGLHRREGETFRPFTTKDGLSHDAVWALWGDHKGVLWIGTYGGGLNRLEGGRFLHYTTKDGLASDMVRAIYEDRQGRLWVGTSAGLNRLEGDSFTRYTTKDGLAQDIVISLVEDREGTLWIGTNGGGVNQMRDGRIVPLPAQSQLADTVVYEIFEDREGSVWLGTYLRGLHRLCRSAVAALTTRDGLSHDILRAIHEGRDGSLWIATNGGGVSRFKDGRFTTIGKRDGLSSEIVISVQEDSRGDLWAGTYLSGLNRIREGKVVAVYGEKEGLPSNSITSILEDRRGGIWVGTYGGGIVLLKGGRTSRYTSEEGLSNDVVRTLYEDRKGDLYVGTNDGLSRLREGAIVRYGRSEGLTGAVVSVYEDEAGSLWVGTRGAGLYRLKDGRFRACTSREGLFNDVVYSILEDGHGYLWMSCDKGIFRVRKKDLDDFMDGKASSVESMAYGREDGMPSSQCSGGFYPAGWRARDGRLYFPTIRGLAVVDPSWIRPNAVPPPVVIEAFRAGETPVDIRRPGVVPPGRGKLEFHYTGLSFLAARKIRFRYKLEGFDKDWVDAGTRRTAYYTNIPPGRYRFSVTACNSDGVWNEGGSALEFALAPHFYQTSWFYALCGLGLALLVAAGHRVRVGHLEARERDLAARVDEALAQVKTLSGLLPICASCKSIRDDKGYWRELETYLAAHSEAALSHGLCPKCMKELYPEYADEALRRTK